MNLKRRMKHYFNVENYEDLQSKKKKQTAYRLLKSLQFLENNGERVYLYVKYVNKQDLKYYEEQLLCSYFNEHFEVPPFNMGLS